MKQTSDIKNASRVVVVLPYQGDRLLMQLRDFKTTILFPGCWGFFGGTIEPGEDPKASAMREVIEELGFHPKSLEPLEEEHIPELGNIFSYAYYCELTVPVEKLVLTEGLDLGLFTLEQIQSTQLYSKKLDTKVKVVPSPHMARIAKKMFDRVKNGKP